MRERDNNIYLFIWGGGGGGGGVELSPPIISMSSFLGHTVVTVKPADTVVVVNETAFMLCEASYDVTKVDLVYIWLFEDRVINTEEDPHFVQVRYFEMNNTQSRIMSFWAPRLEIMGHTL